MTPEERELLVCKIAAAVHIRSSDVGLTDEEQRWVRQAIHRQAQSIKLRQAVIEKTLAGLVWAAIVGLGLMAMSFLREHGLK